MGVSNSSDDGDDLEYETVPDVVFQTYDTWRQPNASRPTMCVVNLGVIADDGQNGHINIDLSSNASSVTYPAGFTWGYVGVRQEDVQAGADDEEKIGAAQTISFIVPAGWSYRYRRETISGFAAPTYSIGNSGATWEFTL